jgi:AGZA family xanthine/uracil permease-like MFS transporter
VRSRDSLCSLRASTTPTVARRAPRWVRAGDLNGFLGLALDNVTQLVILSGALIGVFGFPADLVLHRMVPGTALGVLVGDLVYTWLAVRLMQKTGRDDVTAMPFGIDTPTLFAMVFGVLGPLKLATGDAELAWKAGMLTTIAIGVVKVGLALTGEAAQRFVPRAALLGSIAGVAVLMIAFLPALKLIADPLVGLVALGILLLGFFGRVRMPLGLPAAFAALVTGTTVFWGRALLGGGSHGAPAALSWHPAMPWPTLAWRDAWTVAAPYLSVAMPFALVTTIGGIDNTESAAAAGDEYRARDVLMTEALATIIAGMCGGVVQNTPYIGHPAYKAMGARAGYTLATGLVIGVGAVLGGLAFLVGVLPEAAVASILVFIGLEITAQGFLASPARHGPAVALAFVPVAAAVVLIQLGSVLGASAPSLGSPAHTALLVLGNGFILTAVLWAWALAAIIDGRFAIATALFAATSAVSLFGLVHSPLPSGALFWPWAMPSSLPRQLAGAYGLLAVITCAAALTASRRAPG